MSDKAAKIPANKAVPTKNSQKVSDSIRDLETYVEGYCCSNLDFIEEAISCSVVKLAIAS